MRAFDLLGPMLAAMAVTVAGLAVAAAISFWKPEAGRRMAIWLAPAAGFAAGALLVRGMPSLPPVEAAGWIWYGVLLAAVAGCCAPRRPGWLAWAGRLAGVSLLVYLLLRPLIGRVWEGFELALWSGGSGLIWLLAWTVLAVRHSRQKPWKPICLLVLASVGLAVLLMVSGTASYSQYALALAGAMAGAGLVSLACGSTAMRFIPEPRPAAAMVAIPWMGFLVAGHFYADVPVAAGALAAASLLSLTFPVLPGSRSVSEKWILSAQIAWTVLTMAAAIVIANAMAPRFDY